MIIIDDCKVAFVHIAKCGGTTVRHCLRNSGVNLHEFKGVRSDTALGEIDIGHIPLFVLKDFYSREYRAVQEYWSFAIVRDPYARFASSVTQRLKMYGPKPIELISKSALRRCIETDMLFLSKHGQHRALLPANYIHFQRQCDYVSVDGTYAVSEIYPLQRMDLLLADLERRLGRKLLIDELSKQLNKSLVFRNDTIRSIANITRPFRRVLNRIPNQLRNPLSRLIYVDRDNHHRAQFNSDEIRSFIAEFYAADLILYDRVRNNFSNR